MNLIAFIPSMLSGQGFVCFARDAQGRRCTGYGPTFLAAWDDATREAKLSPLPTARARANEGRAVLDSGLLEWESAR